MRSSYGIFLVMDPNCDVSGSTVTWGCLAYPCRPGVLGIFLSGLLNKRNRSSDVLAAVWLAIRLLRLVYYIHALRSSCNRLLLWLPNTRK